MEKSKNIYFNYVSYQWQNMVIPYSVRGNTFDTLSDIPHEVKECIRFMADNDVRSLVADSVSILQVARY